MNRFCLLALLLLASAPSLALAANIDLGTSIGPTTSPPPPPPPPPPAGTNHYKIGAIGPSLMAAFVNGYHLKSTKHDIWGTTGVNVSAAYQSGGGAIANGVNATGSTGNSNPGWDPTVWCTVLGTFGSCTDTVLGAGFTASQYWCALEANASTTSNSNSSLVNANNSQCVQVPLTPAVVTAYNTGTKALTVSNSANFFDGTGIPAIHTPIQINTTITAGGAQSTYLDTVAAVNHTTNIVTLTNGPPAGSTINTVSNRSAAAVGGMLQRFGEPNAVLIMFAINATEGVIAGDGMPGYTSVQHMMNHAKALWPDITMDNYLVMGTMAAQRLDGTLDELAFRQYQKWVTTGPGSRITLVGSYSAGATTFTVSSGDNLPSVGSTVFISLVPVSSSTDCAFADPTTCVWSPAAGGTKNFSATVASGTTGTTLKISGAGVPTGFVAPNGAWVGDGYSLIQTQGDVAGGSTAQTGFIGDVNTPGTVIGDYSLPGHTVQQFPLPFVYSFSTEVICTLTNGSTAATSCTSPALAGQLSTIAANVTANGNQPNGSLILANNCGLPSNARAQSIQAASFTLSAAYTGTTGKCGMVLHAEDDAESGQGGLGDPINAGILHIGAQVQPTIDAAYP